MKRPIWTLLIAIMITAPAAHATLVLHLKGDTGVATGGSGVTDWTDQSANGQDVSVGTLDGSNNPDVGATLNSKATVSFTSANSDLLVRNGDVGTPAASGLPGIADDFHGFVVVRPTGNQAAAWGNLVSWGPAQGSANAMVLIGISAAGAGLEPFIAPLGSSLEEGTSLSIGTAYIIEFYGDGDNISSATYAIGLDGGSFTTGVFGSLNNSAPVDLGVGHSPATSLFLDGDVAEIRLYDSLLTENERQTIGAELETYWGISAAYVAPTAVTISSLAAGGDSIVRESETNDVDLTVVLQSDAGLTNNPAPTFTIRNPDGTTTSGTFTVSYTNGATESVTVTNAGTLAVGWQVGGTYTGTVVATDIGGGISTNTFTLYAAYDTPPYETAVLALNPIRYYRFEESTVGSGDTLTDETANDTTTYSASVTTSTGPALGGIPDPNQAVVSPQTSIGVGSVTGDLPYGNTERTIVFWYKTNGGSHPAPVGPIWGYGGTGGQGTFQAMSYFSVTWDGVLRTGQSGSGEVPSTSRAADTWHFAAITMDPAAAGSATVTVYEASEGGTTVSVQGGPTATTMNTPSGNPLYIGGSPGYSGFNGEMDELAIFDYALTTNQINNILNATVEAIPGEVTITNLLAGGDGLIEESEASAITLTVELTAAVNGLTNSPAPSFTLYNANGLVADTGNFTTGYANGETAAVTVTSTAPASVTWTPSGVYTCKVVAADASGVFSTNTFTLNATLDYTPALWLRGDLGITTAGGTVTLWADQSGQANDVGHNTVVASDEPDNSSTLNAMNVVTFDGAVDIMARNGDGNIVGGGTASGLPAGVDPPLTGFIVLKTSDADGARVLTFGAVGLLADTYHVGFNAAGAIYSGYLSAGFFAGNTTPVNDGVAHIIEFSFDGATHRVYLDGVLSPTTDGALDSLVSHSINIAFNQNSGVSSEELAGDIAEVRLYDAMLSEGQRQTVGLELQTYWGISGSYGSSATVIQFK